MTAPRRRWPSESALRNAIGAVMSACGGVAGVKVNEDGSFEVLTAALEKDERGDTVADRIRRLAG